MRCAVAASTMVVTVVLASQLLAKTTFPYVATIRQGDTPVRSGPSYDFYETDRLPTGTRVEVYRHDGDGWCAIRPPQGSFSWIPAEYLQATERSATARVVKTPLKTRVGSNLDDLHDVEYISLRQGELVQLLGSARLADGAGQLQHWFRIAPPAGEFRWVHASDLLEDQRSMSEVPVESKVPDQRGHNSAATGTDELVGKDAITTYPLANPPVLTAELKKASVAHAFNELEPTRTVGATYEVAAKPSTLDDASTEGSTWRAVTEAKDILVAPEPRSFQQRLGALNLLLSQTVLASVADWNLDPLLEQAALLVEESATSAERWEATALLEKTREFLDLKIQKLELAASEHEASHEEPSPLPSFSTDASLAPIPEMPRLPRDKVLGADVTANLRPREVPDNSIFDATGLLVSVVSGRPDMPRYALTDDNGRILRFIAPDHTLNVNNYLNRRVGIIGEAGYLRRFKKPFLAARKIVALEH